MANNTPDALAGEVLAGRFRIVEVVSSGANTIIADAVDMTANVPVTVKIVQPELAAIEDFGKVFRRRIDLAMQLGHPNIARVVDWGDVVLGGQPTLFWAVEFLGGGSLRDLLDRGRSLTPSQALIVGLEACRALDAAHQAGVAHTELTPSKLVFGADRRLRIVDFAMAQLLGAPAWAQPSSLPTHVARYASPEQASGAKVGPPTDVYSLALVLVEAVTGAVPFAADSTVATLDARLDRLLPVSADFGSLAAVLERAGRPDPEDRASAAEFGRALVGAASKLPRPEPIEVLPSSFDTTGMVRTDMPAASTDGTDMPAADTAEEAATAPTDAEPPLDAPAAADSAASALVAGAAVTDVGAEASSAAVAEPQLAAEPEPDLESEPTSEPEPDLAAGTDTASLPATEPIAQTAAPTAPTPAAEPDLESADALPPTQPLAPADSAALADSAAPAEPVAPAATAPEEPVAPAAAAPVAPPAGGEALPAAPAAAPPADVTGAGQHTAVIDLDRASPTAPSAAPATERLPVAEPVGSAALPAGASGAGEPVQIYDDEGGRRISTVLVFTLVVLAGLAALSYAGWALLRTKSFAMPDLVGQSEAVALNEIAGNGWTIERTTERSDEFPEPGTVLQTTPVAGVVLDEGATMSMVISDGPQFRTLPEVTGQTFDAAVAALDELGLTGVSGGDEFSETDPPGTVLRWEVAGDATLTAGAQVLPGETIVMVLSSGPAPRDVPDLSGLTPEAAAEALNGLQLELIDGGQEFSDTVEAGLVLSQDPAPGASVERGTSVTVTISRGPDVVALPDLTGLTFQQAADALDAAGFTVGSLLGTTDGVFESLTIGGESVPTGTVFPRGTAVDLVFI